jgi:hypothetical protein
MSITVDYDRKLETLYRGGVLQSSISDLGGERSERRPFHILSTKLLEGGEVLVYFSDGTAGIFELEELEKLRPTPKQMLACAPAAELAPIHVEAVATRVSAADSDGSLILGEAVA